MRKTILIGALAALGGCGGDSGSAFEAVYTISVWTENPAACTEGASILPQPDTAIFIKHENFLGTRFLNGVRCSDVAECVNEAQDDETLQLGGYTFEDGNDANGWSGGFFYGFPADDGTCTGDFEQHVLTGEAGVEIRIESRTVPVGPIPGDGEGGCEYQTAKEAARDGTCTALAVLVATYETDF